MKHRTATPEDTATAERIAELLLQQTKDGAAPAAALAGMTMAAGQIIGRAYAHDRAKLKQAVDVAERQIRRIAIDTANG